MASPGSITQWLGRLQAGDRAGAEQLWQRYFERLVRLARTKLQGRRPQSADEEDVALSALKSFCLGAEAGRFPRLEDRGDLWQILVMLTARKTWALLRREDRQKRGGGNAATGEDLDAIVGTEPTPAFAAQLAEELANLLDHLEDDDLRQVALWKMEGFTNDEIAAKLGCVPRTVERKLWTIRKLWQEPGEA